MCVCVYVHVCMYMYVCMYVYLFVCSTVYDVCTCMCVYRLAGIYREVKFSWFSWLRGEPRNFYPQNSNA